VALPYPPRSASSLQIQYLSAASGLERSIAKPPSAAWQRTWLPHCLSLAASRTVCGRCMQVTVPPSSSWSSCPAATTMLAVSRTHWPRADCHAIIAPSPVIVIGMVAIIVSHCDNNAGCEPHALAAMLCCLRTHSSGPVRGNGSRPTTASERMQTALLVCWLAAGWLAAAWRCLCAACELPVCCCC